MASSLLEFNLNVLNDGSGRNSTVVVVGINLSVCKHNIVIVVFVLVSIHLGYDLWNKKERN